MGTKTTQTENPSLSNYGFGFSSENESSQTNIGLSAEVTFICHTDIATVFQSQLECIFVL